MKRRDESLPPFFDSKKKFSRRGFRDDIQHVMIPPCAQDTSDDFFMICGNLSTSGIGNGVQLAMLERRRRIQQTILWKTSDMHSRDDGFNDFAMTSGRCLRRKKKDTERGMRRQDKIG